MLDSGNIHDGGIVMHAQVVRIKLQPGKADQAAEIFNSSVLPAVKGREGFKVAYFLLDREGDEAIGFSAYDTKEQLEAVISSGFFQEQVAKLADVVAGPPDRKVYEVAASSS